MAARRLDMGQRFAAETGPNEMVHVILGGRCHIRTSAGDFLHLGRRLNVFAGLPWALYLPPGTRYEIEALTNGFEVASCWVPADEPHPARLVRPQDCAIELRGGENMSRQITSVLPPGFDCQRLVAVEVYTPGGNWSSYPPHKHDVHRVAEDGSLLEADLEEIYFYKHDRPTGYACQRVYTTDGRLDELVRAQHHDTVLVPEGYHPVVSAGGYTTYYLNFLAGSAQSLANTDDPAHAWVKSTWQTLDPRVPVVTLDMETS
jgi:5-deoxy-glucuronate isomerase